MQRFSVGRVVLTSVAMTLTAGLLPAQEATDAPRERPPIARITGGRALVKEKGQFRQTWVHPDESLHRYEGVFVWNVAFQFRDVGRRKSTGTTASILHTPGNEPYPVAEEHREKFRHVVVDGFIKELRRSERFHLVDEVGPATLVVRGAVMDIVSWVPPSNALADVYLSAVGEGTVVFELIDPETGLMQARVGERSHIQPTKHTHQAFSRPARFSAVWPDVDRWARTVASDLRHELEDRLKEPE